jgi:hypothetical protein
MVAWTDFHTDPRKSYYLFLRKGYECPAHLAHARVKQVDAMIMGLHDSPREVRARVLLIALMGLAGAIGRARMSLKRLWEHRLASRFSQAG